MDEESHIAVEIGPRTSSIIQALRTDLYDWDKDKALLLEKDEAWRGEMARFKMPDEEPLIADGAKMPLKSGSVKTVFSKDVYTSDNIRILSPDGGYSSKRQRIDFDGIAAESMRVLEPGGKAVVLETASPMGSEWRETRDRIKNAYTGQGFELVEDYTELDANKIFKDGVEVAMASDNFALVFKKP